MVADEEMNKKMLGYMIKGILFDKEATSKSFLKKKISYFLKKVNKDSYYLEEMLTELINNDIIASYVNGGALYLTLADKTKDKILINLSKRRSLSIEEISEKFYEILRDIPAIKRRKGFTCWDVLRDNAFESAKTFIDNYHIDYGEVDALFSRRCAEHISKKRMLIRRGLFPSFPRYFHQDYRSCLLKMDENYHVFKRHNQIIQ